LARRQIRAITQLAWKTKLEGRSTTVVQSRERRAMARSLFADL
jgi:hypothetical protein